MVGIYLFLANKSYVNAFYECSSFYTDGTMPSV